MHRDAVEALFVHHERGLRIAVRRWVQDPEDAAEIVQEAFARVWKTRTTLRPDSAAAYLYRTGLNLAASKQRWQRVRSGLRHKVVDHDLARAPEQRVLDEERAAAVRDAMDALPADLRRVVELRDVTELSYAEIATILKIKPGTVGSRRHTALARLRTALVLSLAAAVIGAMLLRPATPRESDPIDDLLTGVQHPALVGWGRQEAAPTALEAIPTTRAGVRMYRVR